MARILGRPSIGEQRSAVWSWPRPAGGGLGSVLHTPRARALPRKGHRARPPDGNRMPDLTILMPCLERGRDARHLHRKASAWIATPGSTARSSSPTTAAPTGRRRSPRSGARGSSASPSAATARRSTGGMPAARGRYRHHGRRRRQLRLLRPATRFVEQLRAGRRPRHGQPLPGRHRRPARCRGRTATSATRRCPWSAGCSSASRSATSTAGCAASPRDALRRMDLRTTGHGVRQRDGDQGLARAACASPRCRPP